MQNKAILSAILLTVMVTACGSAEQPEVIEQIVVRDPGEPVTSIETVTDGAQDLVAAGQDAFQMCSGCHAIEPGAPSAAGPNLHGVIGRVAGSLDGYPYSDALIASDIVWDEASLDDYLADPGGYLPGTDMLVGTVNDAETRAAIVAYLASKSASETGE